MKKILISLITLGISLTTYAQPRTIGMRIGCSGMEADYQHTMDKNQFIEGCFGLDFGYNANGICGAKATGTYNFVWARPAWTEQGSWALYAGPGATLGYVNDEVHYLAGNNVIHFIGNGFMLGICGQVGLEYNFPFPLQLSVDLRPVIGMHVNSRHTGPDGTKQKVRVGFYDNGLLGLVPNISIRYRF